MKNKTEKYVYMLRTSNADGKSHSGFQWPKTGPVALGYAKGFVA